MLGRIKEKLRMTVYKAVILEPVGESQLKRKFSETKTEQKFGKLIKTETITEKIIEVPHYRVVKIKYVNPNKEFIKLKIKKIEKALPIDFSYEAYYHNEKHVLLLDWKTGRALKMGGGTIDYARPPKEEAMKDTLIRSVGELIRGRQQLMLILMALGLGIFAGIFIGQTLLPMLQGMG